MARQSLDPVAGKFFKNRVAMKLKSPSMELGGSETNCSIVETFAGEFGEKFATALALLKGDILSIKARYDNSGGKL